MVVFKSNKQELNMLQVKSLPNVNNSAAPLEDSTELFFGHQVSVLVQQPQLSMESGMFKPTVEQLYKHNF